MHGPVGVLGSSPGPCPSRRRLEADTRVAKRAGHSGGRWPRALVPPDLLSPEVTAPAGPADARGHGSTETLISGFYSSLSTSNCCHSWRDRRFQRISAHVLRGPWDRDSGRGQRPRPQSRSCSRSRSQPLSGLSFLTCPMGGTKPEASHCLLGIKERPHRVLESESPSGVERFRCL